MALQTAGIHGRRGHLAPRALSQPPTRLDSMVDIKRPPNPSEGPRVDRKLTHTRTVPPGRAENATFGIPLPYAGGTAQIVYRVSVPDVGSDGTRHVPCASGPRSLRHSQRRVRQRHCEPLQPDWYGVVLPPEGPAYFPEGCWGGAEGHQQHGLAGDIRGIPHEQPGRRALLAQNQHQTKPSLAKLSGVKISPIPNQTLSADLCH